MPPMGRVLATLLLLAARAGAPCATAGVTSPYRRSLQMLPDMPLDADVFRPPSGFNAPEQVHITLGDQTGRAMIVSWVTPEHAGSSVVRYGPSAHRHLRFTAEGTVQRYTFGPSYRSGYIHHATLTGLEYGTRYSYRIGFGYAVRTFSFKTPPKPGPDAPFKFGLIGDLGLTYHSNDTLTRYEASNADAVLFLGDLSYADSYPQHDNRRWDSWGRFAERVVAYPGA